MCDRCYEDHKFLFFLLFLVLMLSVAVTAASGRYLNERINKLDKPGAASTWHPKAEDDYPACWTEYNSTQPGGTELICGPMWAMDPSATVPGSAKP